MRPYSFVVASVFTNSQAVFYVFLSLVIVLAIASAADRKKKSRSASMASQEVRDVQKLPTTPRESQNVPETLLASQNLKVSQRESRVMQTKRTKPRSAFVYALRHVSQLVFSIGVLHRLAR